MLARYDTDRSGLMELDEFARLAHSLGFTGGGAPALGAPALPPPLGAAGGWADEGTRRAGELVVLLGGVSDLPASPNRNPNPNPNRDPNPTPTPTPTPTPNPSPNPSRNRDQVSDLPAGAGAAYAVLRVGI